MSPSAHTGGSPAARQCFKAHFEGQTKLSAHINKSYHQFNQVSLWNLRIKFGYDTLLHLLSYRLLLCNRVRSTRLTCKLTAASFVKASCTRLQSAGWGLSLVKISLSAHRMHWTRLATRKYTSYHTNLTMMPHIKV